MAAEKIQFRQLEQWVNDYIENAIGRETRNVVIHLKDIIKLVDYCKNHTESDKINTIRFYLVRQNEKGRDIVFNGQSQISLVGVPVINYKDNDYDVNGNLIDHEGGYDLKEGNEIFSIFPHDDGHEHSGLCPYNCKGSISGYSIPPA